MNKSQFVDALAAHYEGNRKAATEALEAVVDTITREVARGEKVAIAGLGSFEKKIREARSVRDPGKLKKKAKKKAKTAIPKFRASADLKAVVSGAKKLPGIARVLPGTTPEEQAQAAAEHEVKSTNVKVTPVKKASAAKAAPAKKTTTKAAAKKTVAKTAPAKTAKKTVAKKTSNTAAKKSTTKKAAAKTVGTKAAAVKKTATAQASTAPRIPRIPPAPPIQQG